MSELDLKALAEAAEFTRKDLGEAGTNYPHVRVLLAFAERALSAPCREAVAVKALDLSTLLRHAFLSGRGLLDNAKLSAADQVAWMSYDPEPLTAFQRISVALSATEGVPQGEAKPVAWLVKAEPDFRWHFCLKKEEAEHTAKNFLAYVTGCTGARIEPLYASPRADAVTEALRKVQKLIAEAAMTGFNWKDGDWAERLYASQQETSRALKKETRS